jgi:hypothetical protein
MTLKTNTKLSAVIATLLVLGACADDRPPLASMSCTDLAREIGRATQSRDDAAIDSLAGTIDILAADNRADEISGGVDSLVGDITGATAQSELDTLNNVFVQKGCR